jgi:DNA ligase (NAD+)
MGKSINTEKTEERMRDLIAKLNDARRVYYPGKEESPLTNKQYDAYLLELEDLEKYAGFRLADSPTKLVGFEEPEKKVEHFAPILSLKDTKNIEDLQRFLNGEDGVLSWKLDGISLVLSYENCVLTQALTRGDGHVGKDVTQNVLQMQNVLKTLPMKHKMIIRGEGVISITDFEKIRQTTNGETYSNPRNMAAGLLNRNKPGQLLKFLAFIPHSIVYLEDTPHIKTRYRQLEYLNILGFDVVPHTIVRNYDLKEEIDEYTNNIEAYEYPVDGLVLSIDDIKVGESRGSTARFPKHSMAFKWPDVSALTKVTGIKWSMSENGLLTPVVIFEPIELEGTTVKQANLHNVKRLRELGIGIGDTISVYKANKIIPEVEENFTRSKTETHPIFCPKCNSPTHLFATDKTEKLYCWNCRQGVVNGNK